MPEQVDVPPSVTPEIGEADALVACVATSLDVAGHVWLGLGATDSVDSEDGEIIAPVDDSVRDGVLELVGDSEAVAEDEAACGAIEP